MNILIVDDSNEKITRVISEIRSCSNNISVHAAEDIYSALLLLKENSFDLLVSDLFLPMRKGEEPKPDGGKKLVEEVVRKTVNSPKYIIGLTQYKEHIPNFSPIWKVLLYSPESNEWRVAIRMLVAHIEKNEIRQIVSQPFLPTLIVEGRTDQMLILESINIFFPDKTSTIKLLADNSAGASWVARQVLIWAYSLNKNESGQYIKAVGLLDEDLAGRLARDEVNRHIKVDSAEAKTFKLQLLSPTFARHIIPIRTVGLNIPVTLEEMIPPKYWHVAEKKGWLERKSKPDEMLDDPKRWDKFTMSFYQYVETLNLTEDQKIYLNKVKEEHKKDFALMIRELNASDKEEALMSFKPLIETIFQLLEV